MSGSKIRLYGSTSGYVELEAPAVAPDGVLTLPATGAFGGLVAVKHVLKTDAFSANVTTTNSVDVTGMSLTHALSDASNKLLFIGSVYIAQAVGTDSVGVAIHDGTSFIAVGDADGLRSQTFASNAMDIDFGARLSHTVTFSFVYEPPSTASTTYTVRVINGSNTTRLLRVNRMAGDANQQRMPAAASSFILQEVSV